MTVDDLTTARWEIRDEMRYDTFGDWFEDGKIEIYAGLTEMQRLAVGIHEFIERVLLHLQGVTQDMVDEWDAVGSDEGYDPRMYSRDPRYRAAHRYALAVERKIVKTAGLDWKAYNQALEEVEVRWRKGRE